MQTYGTWASCAGERTPIQSARPHIIRASCGAHRRATASAPASTMCGCLALREQRRFHARPTRCQCAISKLAHWAVHVHCLPARSARRVHELRRCKFVVFSKKVCRRTCRLPNRILDDLHMAFDERICLQQRPKRGPGGDAIHHSFILFKGFGTGL